MIITNILFVDVMEINSINKLSYEHHIRETLVKEMFFMSQNKTIKEKNQNFIANSEDSKNAKNGYMNNGNASKTAAEQGTKNKY